MNAQVNKYYDGGLMNSDQAAIYIGVGSRRTLESMRWKGTGPKYVKIGRLVRYRKMDLDAYIEARVRG